MNNPKVFVNLWLTLMAIWLIANASLQFQIVASGVLLATLLSLVMVRFSAAYAEVNLTPRALLYYLRYLAVFTWELIRANLNVARLVFSPRIDIHPGIVEIKTNLKTRTGRLVLANSITLTPGTLVVDIRDDTLFVHWIDVQSVDPEAATRAIAARFERYLSVIYG